MSFYELFSNDLFLFFTIFFPIILVLYYRYGPWRRKVLKAFANARGMLYYKRPPDFVLEKLATLPNEPFKTSRSSYHTLVSKNDRGLRGALELDCQPLKGGRTPIYSRVIYFYFPTTPIPAKEFKLTTVKHLQFITSSFLRPLAHDIACEELEENYCCTAVESETRVPGALLTLLSSTTIAMIWVRSQSVVMMQTHSEVMREVALNTGFVKLDKCIEALSD